MKPITVIAPMPPTSNNIYVSAGQGKRFLTTEGKAYKRRLADQIRKECMLTVLSGLDPNRRYRVRLHFFFAAVENKGWKTGKAQTRWKKIDLDNRLKLILDSIRAGVGVDDSATFHQEFIKDCDPTRPRVEVAFWSLDPASEETHERSHRRTPVRESGRTSSRTQRHPLRRRPHRAETPPKRRSIPH